MTLHFISGLPRSGSTLLAAILRQNPVVRASMTGPLADVVCGALKNMSNAVETAMFVSDEQRRRVINGIVEAFYFDGADKIIFDTNRIWCGALPLIDDLFPYARVVCCLRSPAWILDSIERQVQQHPFRVSSMFNHDPLGSVHTRADSMLKGLVGCSLSYLRQAWFGAFAGRLIAIRYESLTSEPAAVMARLYEALKLPPFRHDFENLGYEEVGFDSKLDLPGFHTVRRRIEQPRRKSILPPDLFGQHDRAFWELPGQNPNSVLLL